MENKIKTRPVKRINISKEKLHALYYKENLSYSEIAKKYNCSASVIFDKMKKHGLLPRTNSEATTTYIKTDFSGDLTEKAYLIGFRLGDLNVFRQYLLVNVKSNTTKIEQVSLINDLFIRYGRVRIKEYNKGVFNIQILLNDTFSFLLPKKDSIDRWILDNDNFFMAFLAGYTDAEGNIGVYCGRARIRIGSYDKNLLGLAHKRLLKLGVHNIYHLETVAGKNRQNQDFWRISINKKEDVLRFIVLVKPYLKHKKRCKDLKIAEDNVISRIKEIKDD